MPYNISDILSAEIQLFSVTCGRVKNIVRVAEQLRQLQMRLEQERQIVGAHLLRSQGREVGRTEDGGRSWSARPEAFAEADRYVSIAHVTSWSLSVMCASHWKGQRRYTGPGKLLPTEFIRLGVLRLEQTGLLEPLEVA